MIEATSYAREARVYSAVLVRAAAVCMGRSQHADGAEALAIVFRYSPCENSRQQYERFPRAETDPRRRVAPKKESLCMADRNAVAGTIDTRFFSVARSPVNCACTFAPRKRRRRGSARNFFPLQGQLCKMGLGASRTATTVRPLVPRRRAAAVLAGAPRCGADTQLRPERGTSSRTGAATRSTDAVRRGATEAVNARGTNTIGVHDRTASSQTSPRYLLMRLSRMWLLNVCLRSNRAALA